jgi:hypothetical protein
LEKANLRSLAIHTHFLSAHENDAWPAKQNLENKKMKFLAWKPRAEHYQFIKGEGLAHLVQAEFKPEWVR